MADSALTQAIKKAALHLGFTLVGLASARPHPHFSFFKQWLQDGNAATMEWLTRSQEKRADPQLVLPGAKSFIMCGMSYYRGKPLSVESRDPSKGWISNYAWGDDYHEVVLKRLRDLENEILKLKPEARMKSYVDTGPILERSYAASAGLGWVGKNTCLIHTKTGSFFFIGSLLTDLDLEPDTPHSDHCGKCTRCIDACPTDALTPYHLDARKCISYLTIEHRGEIDPALQEKMGNNLVGCDICQDVCPWNRKIPISAENAFDPRPENFNPPLAFLQEMTQEEFSKRFKGSPIKRVKWTGLKRNVLLAHDKRKQEENS